VGVVLVSDWADEKAREWLVNSGLLYNEEQARHHKWTPSLATLLREIKCDDDLTRAGVLAEVRRVVEEVLRHDVDNCWDWDDAQRKRAEKYADETLSRLEKL
jgi:hypothetical protein